MRRAIALQKKRFADWSDVEQTNTKSDIYYHLKWGLLLNRRQLQTNEYPIRELSVEFIRNGFPLTDGKQIRKNTYRVFQLNQNIHFLRQLFSFGFKEKPLKERIFCLLPVICLSRVLQSIYFVQNESLFVKLFDQWFTQKSIQLCQSICPTLRETQIHPSLRLCPALALQRLVLNEWMTLFECVSTNRLIVFVFRSIASCQRRCRSIGNCAVGKKTRSVATKRCSFRSKRLHRYLRRWKRFGDTNDDIDSFLVKEFQRKRNANVNQEEDSLWLLAVVSTQEVGPTEPSNRSTLSKT